MCIRDRGKTIRELAVEVADILLEDLSRTVPDPHRTLAAFAPKERQMCIRDRYWILPAGGGRIRETAGGEILPWDLQCVCA